MFQDLCTNLIIILILSTFIFAISDISTRLFDDICSRCTNKSSIRPPTPADYRHAFSIDPEPESAKASNASRSDRNDADIAPLTNVFWQSVGAAALDLEAMTVRELRNLCSSDKKRFKGYSKFVSNEPQLRSFVRSQML